MKRQRQQQRPKERQPQYLVPEHDPNDMSLDVPRDWTPEQAAAVFEILDHLQVRIWGRYGPWIQQVLWEKQMTSKPLGAAEIDQDDVPF